MRAKVKKRTEVLDLNLYVERGYEHISVITHTKMCFVVYQGVRLGP